MGAGRPRTGVARKRGWAVLLYTQGMRKLLVPLLAALALLAPATADATVNRQVATTCYQGRALAQRFNPVEQFLTQVGCPTYTFFENGKYVTWTRPVVDLEAADRAANHFWPGCSHEWYGVNDQRSATGWYYTFFHVTC